MHLFIIINCLLLASVTALPDVRHQRDLSKIKKWLSSTIFGRKKINIQQPPVLETGTQYKLYRLPGYDDVLIKVAPKSPDVIEFVFPKVQPANLNPFGKVVGTKSHGDTLEPVKEVNNLLTTGILNGRLHELMKETVSPMFPTLNAVNYVTKETKKTVPAIEARQPVLTEVIKPLEEKVELKVPFEPKYSYKQIQNHQPVLTYTAHNNPNVKVMETIEMKTEFPKCIKKRLDEVIMLGADPHRLVSGQVRTFQASPVVDFSYPIVRDNSYVQNVYGSLLEERFGTAHEVESLPKVIKEEVVRYSTRPMKNQAINPRPAPLYSNKSPQVVVSASKDKSTKQTNEVQAFTHVGDNVPISQTLGPIPPQYIVHTRLKNKTANKINAGCVVATKDTIANGKIPTYVYRQQHNPTKVEKGGEKLETNTNLKTNTNCYYVPLDINTEAKQTARVKDVVYTNKVTANRQSANVPKERLEENKPISFKENPIVVADVRNYSYQQKHFDGSSINVKGNKHGISVNVKESPKGRGDIPDQM